MVGRATVAFTMDIYTEVAEELAEAAAEAIAAFIPRRGKMFSEWVIVTRDRDRRVRAAAAAGLTKHWVRLLTGIGRSTIGRILAASATAGTSIWPCIWPSRRR